MHSKVSIDSTNVMRSERSNQAFSRRILPIILVILFLFCGSRAWSEHIFVHEITVDPSLPNAYPHNTNTIGQAIYWAYNNDIGNTIVRIAAGDFPSFVATPTNKANRVVKVMGTMASGQYMTTISGSTTHQALVHIRESQQSPGSTLIIEDLCIQGSPGGIRVFDDGYPFNTNISINRCKFVNNTGWSIKSTVPISVTNCIFEPNQNYAACEGAILLDGNDESAASTIATIKGNTFSGHYYGHIIKLGEYAGVPTFHYLHAVDVIDNKFDAKYASNGQSNWRPGAIQVAGVQAVNIVGNLFRIRTNTNPGDLFQLRIYSPYYPDNPVGTNKLNVINNTFITGGTDNNVSAMGIDKRFYTVSILNNVISNLNGAGIQFFSDNLADYSYQVQNNLIYNCVSDIINAGTGSGWTVTGQINSDPLLDSNNKPIMNSTVRSPCIDAGHRDTDGDGIPWGATAGYLTGDPDDADPDGTPLDIGARRANLHQFEDYTIPASGAIKWMSYPVVNNLTIGQNLGGSFFSPIVDPSILDWVQWKKEDQWPTTMAFTGSQLYNYTAEVKSVLGYKVKLQDDVSQSIPLPTPGFLAPANTQIQLFRYLSGTTIPNENWIGYFHRSSAHPLDAFAQVLDHVTSIRTQYWSMVRDPKTGGWAISSGNLTLNYGDMVIVTVNQDCSFQWNYSIPVDPKVRAMATAFTFEEKADYTPMYVDMSNLQDLPTELGIYVDGECKGAVVVEGDFTDICVYLDENEILDDQNTELVLYYGGKSAIAQRRSFKPAAGELTELHESGLNFYTLQLSDKSEIESINPVTQLQQNYPNPFNPTTTIAYNLASDGMATLEVYNIKGQRVTTLVNKQHNAGSHTIVWDGKDDSGRAVSSGIYYYRLNTENGSITHKMLLLK